MLITFEISNVNAIDITSVSMATINKNLQLTDNTIKLTAYVIGYNIYQLG